MDQGPASPDQSRSSDASRSPRFGPFDTSVEIERQQAKILARRTPSERLNLALELSAEMITRSQAAVRRAMPGASEDEVMTRWVRLNHGDAIAALFAEGRRRANAAKRASTEST